MNLGFSYVGLIFLVMLIVPNVMWTKHKPINYEKFVGKENKTLLVFERIGQVLVSMLVLIFSDFNWKPWSAWTIWLMIAIALMFIYEVYWARYFSSAKTMKDYYSSFLGFPVAGATLPVLAYFCLAIYGKNPLLAIAVIILGIGHIGIHLQHAKEKNLSSEKDMK